MALECARRVIWGMIYMLTMYASCRGRARFGADGNGLLRSLRRIRFDHLREQDRDHVHADIACTGNVDILQRHRETDWPDNLIRLFGSRRHWNPKPVGRDRRADPCEVDELQALHVGAVRPPEGESAALVGPDGEPRGSRSYPIRLRDMDSP